MHFLFRRAFLVFIAFWLPFQGAIGGVMMSGCGTESHHARASHASHDLDGAQHGQMHAGSSEADRIPGDGSGTLIFGCDGCSVCQQCNAPALPVPSATAQEVPHRAVPVLAVLAPAPVFVAPLKRPPLS